MNYLASGAAWLDQQMTAYGSSPIVITDRAISPAITIATVATIGSTEFEEEGNDGVVATIKTRDFILSLDQLVDADSMRVWPLRGWRIAYAGATYEVYAPVGQQCYRICDGANQRIRIHSRQIDDPSSLPSALPEDDPDE